jgi:uncharacterized MAPEG superfamily protein
MSFLWTTNLSLYTVPAAYILCVAPHVYKTKLYEKVTGIKASDSAEQIASRSDNESKEFFFDKTQPRTFLATVNSNPNPDLTPEIKNRLARAEAASLNGYENIGFYAASVAAANLTLVVVHANKGGAGLRDQIFFTNILSLGYIATRIMYNIEYIGGVTGFRRGGWFWTGVLCATSLFVGSGNAIRSLLK